MTEWTKFRIRSPDVDVLMCEKDGEIFIDDDWLGGSVMGALETNRDNSKYYDIVDNKSADEYDDWVTMEAMKKDDGTWCVRKFGNAEKDGYDGASTNLDEAIVHACTLYRKRGRVPLGLEPKGESRTHS